VARGPQHLARRTAHENDGARPPWRLRPAEEGYGRRGGGDGCSCSVHVDASAPWYTSTVSMGARAQGCVSRQGPLPHPDYPARAPQRADRILDQKLRRVKAEIQRNRRVLQQSVKRWSLEAAAGLPLSPVPCSEPREPGHSSRSAGPPPPLDGRFSCEDATCHPGTGSGLAGCTAAGGPRNSKGKRAGEVRGRARSHELALLHSIPEQTGLSRPLSAL